MIIGRLKIIRCPLYEYHMTGWGICWLSFSVYYDVPMIAGSLFPFRFYFYLYKDGNPHSSKSKAS